ncbi:Enolase-phosphatase E1 [Sarcoptes scabiei]|uniref:Enolase-phosphatase E1 n=1 Tax=Sarcoptes scabiei TaxID=52283 RepID=A0A834RGR3_SARSC|nr:Enolase-phosphatase E1 [Sarcoptes scabiei]
MKSYRVGGNLNKNCQTYSLHLFLDSLWFLSISIDLMVTRLNRYLSIPSERFSFVKPNAVLLDIEGTISEMGFVSRTLFPFIKNNVRLFFEETYDTKETREMIQRLRESRKYCSDNFPMIAPITADRDRVLETITKYSLAHIIRRSRISEIKQLQILIWVWGYEKGLIKGHVYDEVTTVLHQWKNELEIDIFLFSSAMITAQQLLLCSTNYGNCLSLIDDFFDSSIGEKISTQSYLNISEALGFKPERILFITDNYEESRAASSAMFNVCLIQRSNEKMMEISKKNAKNERIPFINSLLQIEFMDSPP